MINTPPLQLHTPVGRFKNPLAILVIIRHAHYIGKAPYRSGFKSGCTQSARLSRIALN
ncbi:MAG: hypothetical protein ACRBBJ_11835 [Rhodomicrobiaceae bacterium]